MKRTYRDDLLYPELSYQIIGVLFEVSNTLGHGFQEKDFQKAIVTLFKKLGIKFNEQVLVKIKINDTVIRKGKLDFIVDDKIILEIKKGEKFLKDNIDQTYRYLKMTGLKLGILANFTSKGLMYKRIVNIRNSLNS